MNKHYYFVYGTLKKGYCNHKLLRDSKKVRDYTTKPEYSMINLHSFPGVVKNGNTAIHGEIYEVIDEMIEKSLDKLEGYNPNNKENFFNKECINLEGKRVFIYILNTSKVATEEYQIIPSGKW
ncbi:gamma-glutamylcyclotransferase [Seonamhaeicola sediminis]|uniref:Gamma-glutamylcyclotransferase family protein n=1 Tax=Seonamhaeicola sediminis TaxID=2528206 RepID=A0A562YF94_9FLAO|nr:gamma-glutamylcyclotransferase family protein [Seonamhaeicola sediminis]TWO33374.1 gamma-glutamylcyclotransferase [Seonamhaeicola sediminis]